MSLKIGGIALFYPIFRASTPHIGGFVPDSEETRTFSQEIYHPALACPVLRYLRVRQVVPFLSWMVV
jgi:hypothetical protein